MTANSWQLRRTTLTWNSRPVLMGIVNVTPDSFSDGGNFFDVGQATAQGLKLIEAGADILDIGGESTRPYSQPVSVADELARVVPVIQSLVAQTSVPISIDTSKAVVARAAIDAGAEIINDITGLTGDPAMISVAQQTGAGVCAMHIQGTPQTMQDHPSYANVVEEIYDYLRQRKQALLDGGIAPEKICLDPGIGFGKTHQHNWELVQHAGRFLELDCPILIGHSRKGFIGKRLQQIDPHREPDLEDRDCGTLGISLWLAHLGISILRVHEVKRTRQALETFLTATGMNASPR